MPEGPEIATLARVLDTLLAGKQLARIEFADRSRYAGNPPANFDKLAHGIYVRTVAKKGKCIYMTLDDGVTIFISMGLTGGFYAEPGAYVRWIFIMADGLTIYMCDKLQYATLSIATSLNQANKKLAAIGYDLCSVSSIAPSLEDFKRTMRRHNKGDICVILMNQAIYSGIGNYLKCEILNDADIYPIITVGNLSDADLERLYYAIGRNIAGSVAVGGARIKKYTDLYVPPATSSYQLQVYERDTTPTGDIITKLRTLDGRWTYYRATLGK
jgi:formamidopyrimidine-DNA glycosylase